MRSTSELVLKLYITRIKMCMKELRLPQDYYNFSLKIIFQTNLLHSIVAMSRKQAESRQVTLSNNLKRYTLGANFVITIK